MFSATLLKGPFAWPALKCGQLSPAMGVLPRVRRSANSSMWTNATVFGHRNRSLEPALELEDEPVEACHSLYFLLDFFHLYYIPSIILLGLVGNLLSCVVFLNTHLKMRSSSYYLAALATADFGFLVSLLLVWLNSTIGWRVFNKDGWCETLVYVSAVCSSLSVWLIVAFTVERFIAVQYPLHRPHMCTIARAKAIVFALVVLAFTSHSYSFVTAGVVKNQDGYEICDLKPDYLETMRIISIIDSIASLIAPLVLIVVMNTMIMRNLLRFSRRFRDTPGESNNYSSRDRSDVNLNQVPEIVSDTIRTREERGIARPDVIQLMMEGKKERTMDLSIEDMTAQAFVFFAAGFDAASTFLSFLVHSMATNPRAQARLREEIDEALSRSNGPPTYETITRMRYMDAVTSETLRLYPLTAFLDRLCVKDFELPPAVAGGKPLTIKPGTNLWFPSYAVHRDPDYFPEPDRFDPDRFLDEKHGPSVYAPFGVGPRICIGNRFALMQAKVVLFYLLAKCEFEPCSRTSVPLKLSEKTFVMTAKGGFWVKARARRGTQ